MRFMSLIVGALAVALTFLAPSPASAASDVDAAKLLAKVKAGGEKASAKYKRSAFKHWTDADRDGCDTRREVLIAEATKKPKVSKKGCDLTKGRWKSYYDNKTFKNPSKLDIDHMVPLAEAWRSGASGWNAKTREKFANDLGYAPSLVAVSAATNRSKSDRDLADWLPKSNRCRYVAEWVAVKYRWSLTMDSAEKKAAKKVLGGCKKSQRKVAKPTKVKIVKGKTNSPDPKNPDEKVKVVAYANCTALKAVHPNGVAKSKSAAQGLRYAPLVHAKLYEANAKMDRDKDGVACERG